MAIQDSGASNCSADVYRRNNAVVECRYRPFQNAPERNYSIYGSTLPVWNPDNIAREYFREDITPAYQVTLARVYLGISLASLVVSAFLRGRKSSWLLGLTGTVYIGYLVVSLLLIINRTGVYAISLQGQLNVDNTHTITTGLHKGYYLAYISGFSCIMLALLRKVIIKQSDSNSKT
jgi:hypothetical protein